MATNKKISEYDALSSPATTDLMPIVDVSDITHAASGTTKNILLSTLSTFFEGLILTATKIKAALGISTLSGSNTGDEVVATGAEVNTGSDNDKMVTPKAMEDSDYAKTAAIPVKAIGSELDTGTNDDKFVTAKSINDSHNVPSVAPSTSGNVMTSNGTDWISVTPTASVLTYLNQQAMINGNFDVWQRGVTYSTFTDSTAFFLADRWREIANDDGGTKPTLTRTREALTAGDIYNSFYYSRLTTDGAGSSLGNGSYHFMQQRIEHGTRNLCGNGKKVTLSFYARSSIANKKIAIWPIQNYGTGGSPTAQEAITAQVSTLTSNWTKYTYTFTTNTLAGKTFGTANDDYLEFNIAYEWGSTYNFGGTTEDYVGSGTIDIAQVQLCTGDVALPFMPKSYDDELRACRRYYYRPGFDSPQLYYVYANGFCASTTACRFQIFFPVHMRIEPTLETSTISLLAIINDGSIASFVALTALSLNAEVKGTDQTSLDATVATGGIENVPVMLLNNASTSGYIAFNSEL